MIIIFDTTETFSHPTLRGAQWEKIGRFLMNGQHRGIVPEVVFEETYNHIRERYEKAREELSRLTREFNELSLTGSPPQDSEYSIFSRRNQPHIPPAMCQRNALKSRMESLKLTIQPIELTQIRPLLMRSLARRKPFDKTGQRGFRDAAIWEVVLSALTSSDDKVVLITRNKGDFGRADEVHGDLMVDINNLGCDGRFVLFESLDVFTDTVVNPTLQKASNALDDIRSGRHGMIEPIQFWCDHVREIEGHVSDSIHTDSRKERRTLMRDLDQPILIPPLALKKVSDIDAFHLDDNLLAITIVYIARAIVNGAAEYHFESYYNTWIERIDVVSEISIQVKILIEEQASSIRDVTYSVTDCVEEYIPELRRLNYAALPDDFPKFRYT